MAWSKDPTNQGKQGRPRTRDKQPKEPKVYKNKPGAGRPSKFTKAIGEEICKCIALGTTLRVAAGYVGVTAETIENWVNQGLTGANPDLIQFAIDVERAHSKFIIDNLTTLDEVSKDKGNKNRWLSSAWRLERCVPGQPFAVVNRQQVQVQDVTVRDQAIASAETKAIESLEARVIDVEVQEQIEYDPEEA